MNPDLEPHENDPIAYMGGNQEKNPIRANRGNGEKGTGGGKTGTRQGEDNGKKGQCVSTNQEWGERSKKQGKKGTTDHAVPKLVPAGGE